LLDWWQQHGRHDLPWQHPRTPYRVWISEVMLQQTQVATVIPYFERWMARFPDLATLATAPEDEVLAHWAGLGYYARARNLHDTARECVERFGGELPADPDVLASLPGIGASTANAIVSQAHDIPLPILDGNAKRVLARHAAIEGWTSQSSVARALWQQAEARLPEARGADYSQAIMDLGATLCTARDPACPDCPVAEDCRARIEDRIAEFPGRKPRAEVREQPLCLLLWQHGDALLMERRPPAGIWGGLWCPPQGDTPGQLAARFGIDEAAMSAMPTIEHRLTHRLLRITPLWTQAAAASRGVECGGELAWQPVSAWPSLGLPKPVTTLLAELHELTRQETLNQ
jgi:A/G-specific adenine glycosylase